MIEIKKIYYGYVVAAASFMFWFAAWGTFTTFSIFLKPLIEDFGWLRADITLAYSVSCIVQAICALGMGRLTDKFGPRLVVGVFGSLIALSYLLLSKVAFLWQYQLVYAVICGIGLSTVTVPIMTTIARWFDKKRGTVSGVVQAGMGIGGLVFAPFTGWMILEFGWRTSYQVLGFITLPLILLSALLLKGSPEDRPNLPNKTTAGGVPKKRNIKGFTIGKAIKTRQFWMIALMSLVTMVLSSILPNIPVTILMMGFVLTLLNQLGAPFRSDLTALLLLCIAFPAVIGGIVTPIGATTPNFLIISITQDVLGVTIPFSSWVIACLPIAAIQVVAMLLIFKFCYSTDLPGLKSIREIKGSIVEEYSALGQMSKRESFSLYVLCLAIFLFMVPGLVTISLGQEHSLAKLFNTYLSMEKVALFAAIVLLIIPIDWKNREYVLSWKEAGESLDLGLFLFIAVTMTLPAAFMETGLLDYVTIVLQDLVGEMFPILVVFILACLVSLLSQLGLQMPLIALFIPITASLIDAIGGNPLAAVLAVGMAAVGTTYAVPVSTPVHVIPFSTGRISMGQFAKSGVAFSIVSTLLLVFVLYPLACLIL